MLYFYILCPEKSFQHDLPSCDNVVYLNRGSKSGGALLGDVKGLQEARGYGAQLPFDSD